jgi:hypothetical protein
MKQDGWLSQGSYYPAPYLTTDRDLETAEEPVVEQAKKESGSQV